MRHRQDRSSKVADLQLLATLGSSMLSKRKLALLMSVALVVLTIATLLARPGGVFGVPPSIDEQSYLELARQGVSENQLQTHHRTRILVPLLVSVLPFAPEATFQVVTFLGLLLFIGLNERVAVQMGLSARQTAGVLLFLITLFYPLVYYTRYPFLVDAALFPLWTLSILLTLRKRLLALAFTLCVGLLVKEVTLFLAPACFYLWLHDGTVRESAKRTTLVFLPATAAFLVLRMVLAPSALGVFFVTQSGSVVQTIVHPLPSLRAGASGFVLTGCVVLCGALLRWSSLRPLLRRTFIAGILAIVPIIGIATVLDAGRYLTLFIPFWLPLAASTLLDGACSDRRYWVVLAGLVAGNLLFTAATLLDMGPWGEAGLRGGGLVLQVSSLWVALRRFRAPKPGAEVILASRR